jgi:hypothetical protein
MEGKKEGRKEGHLDRWDKQMASRDGQSDGTEGWTDRMGIWEEPDGRKR